MAYIAPAADAYDDFLASLERKPEKVIVWAKPKLVHDNRGQPGMDVPWREKYIDLTELADMAAPSAWVIFETFIDAEHPMRAGVGGEA